MNDQTPLHCAAIVILDGAELVRILFEYDADVNVLDNKHNTPLALAAELSISNKTIETLIELGAGIHIKNDDGVTPLHLAAKASADSKTVETLVAYGADVNVK
nr:ankyrin repeat protein [Oriental turtle dovepox virus]